MIEPGDIVKVTKSYTDHMDRLFKVLRIENSIVLCRDVNLDMVDSRTDYLFVIDCLDRVAVPGWYDAAVEDNDFRLAADRWLTFLR